MKAKHIFFYLLGIGLLIFGNRDLWDELQEARELEKKQKALAEANKDVGENFETQKLQYDSANHTWKNDAYYFQIVNLGNVNYKALRKKGRTHVETDDDENVSDSQ
ncbi:hypothetical protein LVD15_22040 [Fulvivirga maritima]|uniref:hypothetical protein n=1 Tax=Fulvivirga maritima TaxID=2904247 RepID=UPI001F34DB0D|nr:hypothetical protein [Fulvivirga maritima]UII25955.1 hypothetical protein LVD15_22040 [Fulvivirga maritima]